MNLPYLCLAFDQDPAGRGQGGAQGRGEDHGKGRHCEARPRGLRAARGAARVLLFSSEIVRAGV